MCRFVAYLGQPLLINELISKPKDSLIKQSAHALESDIKLNADGFGIGWYNFNASEIPAVFVSVLPAWNDMNLRNMSHQIRSSCFYGHIRAAAEGGVTQDNCHPFAYQKYLFMHNGGIGGYKKLKRDFFCMMNEENFVHIHGQTDSEAMFALWQTYFMHTKKTLADMVTAWKDTLLVIADLQVRHKVNQPTYINAIVTDGKEMAAIRFSSRADDCLSLHYTFGKVFTHTKEGCHMLPTENNKNAAVIVSSERMTDFVEEWHDVPEQSILTVDKHKKITIISL